MDEIFGRTFEQAIFYQIYPLGLCGAPPANDFVSPPVDRLPNLAAWIPHMQQLGCNALYLGPVFESDFHGYDTADYLMVDRRLGTNGSLKNFSQQLHAAGIRLVLDTVFNHVGRNFPAFKNLQEQRENSRFRNWFCGVDFERQSVYGDPFYYEGWYDAYNLVKLNLANPEVKTYLFSVVDFWFEEFAVDGLRLDVAEIMDRTFLAELAAHCRQRNPDCWLLGEMIKGDYSELANDHMLDATTNYELYESLLNAHRQDNYACLAHTMARQSGREGQYRQLQLYTFADNHDTTRLASFLPDEKQLYLVYVLLFTLPGIPSVYYGSEWGMTGVKGEHDDVALRPPVEHIPDLRDSKLFHQICQLVAARKRNPVLNRGNYTELYQDTLQLAFARNDDHACCIVAVNNSDRPATLIVSSVYLPCSVFIDQLDAFYQLICHERQLEIIIPSFGARILAGITEPTV